jgi:hypothetical protein
MKSITKKQLNFTGWLSIAYGIISIPYTIFVYAFALIYPGETNILGVVLSVLYLGTFIYLYIFLKRFLNKIHKFHNVDKIIRNILLINIIFFVLSELANFYKNTACTACGISLLLLIPLGILLILFGIRLLSLKNDLFGLLKPLSYQTIATGVLLSSVVLFPLSLIPGVITSVIMGIIYIRSASEIHD